MLTVKEIDVMNKVSEAQTDFTMELAEIARNNDLDLLKLSDVALDECKAVIHAFYKATFGADEYDEDDFDDFESEDE